MARNIYECVLTNIIVTPDICTQESNQISQGRMIDSIELNKIDRHQARGKSGTDGRTGFHLHRK